MLQSPVSVNAAPEQFPPNDAFSQGLSLLRVGGLELFRLQPSEHGPHSPQSRRSPKSTGFFLLLKSLYDSLRQLLK